MTDAENQEMAEWEEWIKDMHELQKLGDSYCIDCEASAIVSWVRDEESEEDVEL